VAIANVIALSQPQVLRLAVDDLYGGVTAAKLGRYALILFGIALAAGTFRYWMRQAVIGISRQIEFDLRNDLFAHLQALPLQYFQHTRTGEIMSRATNDLAAVRMMLGPGIMYLVNTAVVSVVSVGCMLAISPRVAFYSLLPLPFVSLSVWYFGDRIHRRFEEIQALFARLAARVQENLAGVRVVRAFVQERCELDDFAALNREFLDRNLRLVRASGLFQPALGFLAGLAALLALYLGGRDVIKSRITLGEFVAFTVYLAALNWPMVALGWVVNLFQRGSASLSRIAEILDTVPAIASPPAAQAPERVRGAIEIRRLTFTYPGADRPALRDVSLSLPAGATVAFVGRTGSGKSTLLSLLPRLFDPPPGTVFLDGVDVRGFDLGWLRRQVGWAPPWPRTSRTASRRRRRKRSKPRRRSRTSRTTCADSRTVTRPASASAASRCPAASASARRSRARSCATPRSCCSTTACRAWMPTPRRPSCAASQARCGSAPRGSSRTG
jgi:ATP-binding cassette subfamily B protein